jgi:hypothetical protein
MMYRTIMLTIAALSTTQAYAGDLSPSVVVAPGAFYIGSAQIYVTPSPRYAEPYAAPTYEPGYYPGHAHKSYYHGVGPYYGAQPYRAQPGYPPYAGREPGYPPYAVEYAPRPPAAVPYNSRCYIDPTYGRVAYCN